MASAQEQMGPSAAAKRRDDACARHEAGTPPVSAHDGTPGLCSTLTQASRAPPTRLQCPPAAACVRRRQSKGLFCRGWLWLRERQSPAARVSHCLSVPARAGPEQLWSRHDFNQSASRSCNHEALSQRLYEVQVQCQFLPSPAARAQLSLSSAPAGDFRTRARHHCRTCASHRCLAAQPHIFLDVSQARQMLAASLVLSIGLGDPAQYAFLLLCSRHLD